MTDSPVPETVFVLLQDENDNDCHATTARHMPAHQKNHDLQEQVENVSQTVQFGKISLIEYSEGKVLNSSCWYSPKELRRIQQELESSLVRLYNSRRKGESVLECAAKYCDRGLVEGYCFNPRLDRIFMDYDGMRELLVQNGPYYESRTVVGAILSQQEELRELGINDPACLRTRSQSFTEFEKDRAILIGHKDFQQAVSVWREDKDCAEVLQELNLRDDVTVSSKGMSMSRASSVSSICDLIQLAPNKTKLRRTSNTSAASLSLSRETWMDSSARIGASISDLRASLAEFDDDSDVGF